jgi:hypothetical protein
MSTRGENRRISWPAAFALIALIVCGLAAVIFLRLESWPARNAQQGAAELERLGREVKNAFVDVAHLQPRITINSRVYLEQTMPTSELAVLTRRVEVEHEMEHTWAGSSKRVKVHGTFMVKAGFDLRQKLSVDVRPDEIVVQLPRGQILDVEQEKVDVLALENGYWNRISATDVQEELSALAQSAREKANESGLPQQAEKTLQEQLAARIHSPQPLRIRFQEELHDAG